MMALAGCNSERTYEVRGRIAGFGDDGRTIIVEHEDVPGLMPAMTMPLKTRDSGGLRSYETGDAIRFSLVVSGGETWIDDMEKLPVDALPEHPAATDDPMTPARPPLLERGDRIPDLRLLNQQGDSLSLSDFRGRFVLLTFIYTRCPLPDYCPLVSRRFAAIQPRLRAEFEDGVQLISLSVDPQYDTPEVLQAYANQYTDDTATWTFATAAVPEVKRFAGRLGLFFTPAGDEIIHNLTTVLLASDGTIRRIWRRAEWSEEEVVAAIRDQREAL